MVLESKRRNVIKYVVAAVILVLFLDFIYYSAISIVGPENSGMEPTWFIIQSKSSLKIIAGLTSVDTANDKEEKKIVIGAVSCSLLAEKYEMLDNAAVMVKSILVSAKLNNVSEIDAYVFLEHQAHENVFANKFQDFLNRSNRSIVSPKLNLFFRSAAEAVPNEYRDHMVYDQRYRCGYTRMFFSSALPHVDSIIYLDADMIITGNIWKYWQVFSLMNSSQLVGAASNYEPENTNYDFLLEILFGGIPFVPPRGVNSGLLVMNLTRMRTYGWEEKLLRFYEDYENTTVLNHQRILNIFLVYHSEVLYKLDCVFNFLHGDCDKGFVCRGAEKDEIGVHGIHGSNRTFAVGGMFRSIWEMYDKFDVLSGDVFNDLINPIKQSFCADPNQVSNQCYGTLDKYLWKHF